MDIDDQPPSTDSGDASTLEREGLQQSPSARPRFGSRAQLALVFLLALAFSLISSSTPYFAVALAYGPAAARNLSQANLVFFFWLRRSYAAEFFLVFYLIGKRVDFRGQYLRLAVFSFAGVLAGELPLFVSIQTPSPSSSLISGFGLVGVSLADLVSVLSGAFQSFAILLAGLALAFVREGHLREALWPSSPSGDHPLLSRPVLVAGFAITIAAYLAAVFTDIIGSRFARPDQFAFLRAPFPAAFSPYDAFVYDFFYPLLFFVAFYFLGKRLDTLRGGMIAFAISVFVSGALGYLIGNDLVYFVRVYLTPPGPSYAPFSLGLSFLVDSLVQGLYVLAFGFAAASLGFVRNMENPVNRDRTVAIALVAAVLVLLTISILLAIWPASSATVTTISTTATTATSLPK